MRTIVANQYRYFTVQQESLPPGRKTATYYLVNRSSGMDLAVVQWYGAWRQFCFLPLANTVWSEGCLYDVRHFLDALEAGRIRPVSSASEG